MDKVWSHSRRRTGCLILVLLLILSGVLTLYRFIFPPTPTDAALHRINQVPLPYGSQLHQQHIRSITTAPGSDGLECQFIVVERVYVTKLPRLAVANFFDTSIAQTWKHGFHDDDPQQRYEVSHEQYREAWAEWPILGYLVSGDKLRRIRQEFQERSLLLNEGVLIEIAADDLVENVGGDQGGNAATRFSITLTYERIYGFTPHCIRYGMLPS
jgi:hypothetical protein